MGRYSIMVFEHGSDHEVELMQVNDHPEAMKKALEQKTLTFTRSILEPGKRKVKIPKYTFVRIVDHGGGTPSD